MAIDGATEAPQLGQVAQIAWVALEVPDIDVGQVATVVAGGRALCVTRTREGWGVLDNRCPRQGGPLGDVFARSQPSATMSLTSSQHPSRPPSKRSGR